MKKDAMRLEPLALDGLGMGEGPAPGALRAILQGAMGMIHAECGVLLVRQGEHLVGSDARCGGEPMGDPSLVIDRALGSRKVVCAEPTPHPGQWIFAGGPDHVRVQAVIAVPIVAGERVIGVIVLHDRPRPPLSFNQRQRELLEHVGVLAGWIIAPR
jgi:GAF domain-containing protein